MEINEDGYIVDLSVKEAEKIFDDLVLNAARARGNGKSRTLYNYTVAWIKIKETLIGHIQAMNDRALCVSQSVYDLIANSQNGVPVCAVDRDLIYIKAIEKERKDGTLDY